MIYKRQFRENDPALGILDKAFRFVVVVFGFILDIDGCIAMTEMTGAVYSFFIMMIPFDYYFLTTFFPFTIYKPGLAIEATR